MIGAIFSLWYLIHGLKKIYNTSTKATIKNKVFLIGVAISIFVPALMFSLPTDLFSNIFAFLMIGWVIIVPILYVFGIFMVSQIRKLRELLKINKEKAELEAREREAVLNSIRAGKLPKIENTIQINLLEKEQLHFITRATLSKITKRNGRKYITKEGRGDFWVSNKRVGFKHPASSFDIKYSKILSCDTYDTDDGLIIYKSGREKPYIFSIMQDNDIANVILSVYLNSD
ncbi:hypothetical protein NO1_1375 [Candidatus Termititenax aidoneus]|uniref:Uncharacterized protein n=1 Tax=Termititenax aidoneus TaxID=2218524 RepID=A0A388TDZ6_TERA1|nr:hypothetical protein NO1_1375 [Candidatus Termititenax aidoneus]